MRIRSFAFRLVAFFSLGAFFFSGCSTELDSNADYKEIMVIYSVLDPDQTTHYAKVNKAFLNTGTNALTIAANNPDSTQYKDELQVKLEQLRPDSSVIAAFPMERFIATGKEPGIFASGQQVLYRTTGSVILNDRDIYRVVALNTKTGVTASGATQIVQDVPGAPAKGLCIYQISRTFAPNASCYTVTQPSAYEPESKGNAVRFHVPENAKIFTVKLTFKFAETTNGVRQEKEVQWYLRNNFIHEGSSDPEIQLENDFFLNNLKALIDRSQDNATTTREAGDVLITVTGGSQSLETYYRINNSFSIISQTRPEFDNIKEGTGLVASRRSKTARGYLTQKAMTYLINFGPELRFKP